MADNKDAVRDDKACFGKPDVVLLHKLRRVRVLGAVARERGHDDAVFEHYAANLDGC